jgi:GntR family transcriptional regulator, rspAB operon transcriptional repressor
MGDLLRDRLYQLIRRAIIHCELIPGQEVREQILADQYQVSRSPVRDAMLRLEREDLVTVLPRQGYRINPLERRDVEDMFGLRVIIAPACAAAAANAEDAATGELDQFRNGPSGEGDISAAALLDHDRAFHHAVAALAGSGRLTKLENNLAQEFGRIMAIAYNSYGGGMVDAVVGEHADVIDAIQAHRSEEARRYMAKHITQARDRIVKALGWN